MPKVICTLENASELINGVRFVSHADGMISENVSDEVHASFLEIPGYVPAQAADSELDALRARAAELGIEVGARWQAKRLKDEIKAAEDELATKNPPAPPGDGTGENA